MIPETFEEWTPAGEAALMLYRAWLRARDTDVDHAPKDFEGFCAEELRDPEAMRQLTKGDDRLEAALAMLNGAESRYIFVYVPYEIKVRLNVPVHTSDHEIYSMAYREVRDRALTDPYDLWLDMDATSDPDIEEGD